MSSNAIDLDDNRVFHASELAKFTTTIRATVLVSHTSRTQRLGDKRSRYPKHLNTNILVD